MFIQFLICLSYIIFSLDLKFNIDLQILNFIFTFPYMFIELKILIFTINRRLISSKIFRIHFIIYQNICVLTRLK